ncbi:hypothetical protein PsorP6_012100 [Peronosclerospora sorghi]|uniref:Uncharacterized protein n=1 Tax=Peronosclerospora sorghi TaxID=230839 RepID=A0ACC0WJU9_9STRA|nr:hypothetical protein PsorP6_012100 [Peronosclerospora sorghi]
MGSANVALIELEELFKFELDVSSVSELELSSHFSPPKPSLHVQPNVGIPVGLVEIKDEPPKYSSHRSNEMHL